MEEALQRMELLSLKARSLADDFDTLSRLTRDASLSTAGFRDIVRSLVQVLHPLQASLTTISASAQTIQNNLTGAAGLSSAITGATDKINKATETLTQQQTNQNTKRTQNDENREREQRSVWDRIQRKILATLSPLSLLGGVLVAVAAQVVMMQRALAGFDVIQRVGGMMGSITTSITDIAHGILLSPAMQAMIRMTGTREFGGPAPAAIRTELARTTQLGINTEASARLEGMMYRVSGYSQNTAINMSKTVIAMARVNRVGADDLMRELAANAGLLANAANRVPDSLARAAIQAQRIGVSMQGAEGFANKITGDFDTYLEMQAKLQTVMPGLDLTNVMIASQFGSTGDVIQAIQGAFGGRDIGQMPRSIRQMITSTTGISEEELVKYSQAGKAAAVKPADRSDIQKQTSLWQNILAAVARIAPMIIAAISGTLGGIFLATTMTAKNTSPMGAGFFSQLGQMWNPRNWFKRGGGVARGVAGAEGAAETGLQLETNAEAMMRVNQASKVGMLGRLGRGIGGIARTGMAFGGTSLGTGALAGAGGFAATAGLAGLFGIGAFELTKHTIAKGAWDDMERYGAMRDKFNENAEAQNTANLASIDRNKQLRAAIARGDAVMPRHRTARETEQEQTQRSMKHGETDYSKLTHDEIKGLRQDFARGNIKAYVVATDVESHLANRAATRPTSSTVVAGGRG